MPTRYLDPKIDLAFKRVFGEHAHLLKSFLNALLPLPEDAQIESLEYLTPEQVPELPGLFKNSIVDVKCRDSQGRTFIVEMQMLWSASFEQRILFSASQAYVKQLRTGQDYVDLQPVYALALTNQVFDRSSEQYYHHYQIVNLQTPQRVLKGLEFVFVEIPKFKPKSRAERQMQVKWLRFLSEVGDNDSSLGSAADREWRDDPDIAAALKLVEVAAYSEVELEAYHIHMDKARIESSVMKDAKAEGLAEGMVKGVEKGKAEGLAEGLEKGKAEGLAEGVEKGKAEGLAEGVEKGAQLAALRIARSMLALIPDDAAIAAMTGLPVAQITALRNGGG